MGDGSGAGATVTGSEGDASEDDDRDNVLVGDGDDDDGVRASSGTGGRRVGDDGGTARPDDDEDCGEKVAITTATNINTPSRETKEIN